MYVTPRSSTLYACASRSAACAAIDVSAPPSAPRISGQLHTATDFSECSVEPEAVIQTAGWLLQLQRLVTCNAEQQVAVHVDVSAGDVTRIAQPTRSRLRTSRTHRAHTHPAHGFDAQCPIRHASGWAASARHDAVALGRDEARDVASPPLLSPRHEAPLLPPAAAAVARHPALRVRARAPTLYRTRQRRQKADDTGVDAKVKADQLAQHLSQRDGSDGSNMSNESAETATVVCGHASSTFERHTSLTARGGSGAQRRGCARNTPHKKPAPGTAALGASGAGAPASARRAAPAACHPTRARTGLATWTCRGIVDEMR